MDELTIDGKTYLSSKRAAAVTGYAKDYIGQLCREGRVESRLVGRSWYVYEPSIKEHRFKDDSKKEEIAPKMPEESAGTKIIESVWENPAYSAENVTILPELEPVAAKEKAPESEKTLTEMQSAWQEWFSAHEEAKEVAIQKEVPIEREIPRVKETEYVPPVAETVPVRMIVSDIAPKRAYEAESAPFKQAHSVKEARTANSKPYSPKKGNTMAIKALFMACIIVSIAVALVATGLIENLHLTGFQNFAPFQFLQGSKVINN